MKVVSALIGNPLLAAGFIDSCTLPVGIIIKLFQMVRAVMIPLPHLALSKVTTSGILTLPPNGLFFQPFCVKSAVLDTIRTNHQIGEVKCSQFPSCVDFTGFNCIQNCVYCYYLSFFSKIALKHRPHYFHI